MKLEFITAELHPSVVRQIKNHAKREADKGKYEAVGFVAAKKGESVGVATIPLNNHAPDPSCAFFVEPWEQFRAERKLVDQGYDIMGIYHSHVNSEALPSQSDHKLSWANHFVFIYSVVFDELKAYRKVDEFLEPVELKESD